MSNLSGPEDTYKLLVEQSQDNWLYGLVAFAVLEEQRIEWMRHMESKNGSLPDDQQIRDWYQQQPSSVLLRVRGTAENALKVYAEEIAATIEEDYKKDILDDVIVTEIRSRPNRHSIQPHWNRGEIEEGEEVPGLAVESHGDPSELLEPGEAALDAVA